MNPTDLCLFGTAVAGMLCAAVVLEFSPMYEAVEQPGQKLTPQAPKPGEVVPGPMETLAGLAAAHNEYLTKVKLYDAAVEAMRVASEAVKEAILARNRARAAHDAALDAAFPPSS